MKYRIISGLAVFWMFSTPAIANHCDADMAAVEAELASPSMELEPATLDAAEHLFGRAVEACDYEDVDLPLLDPEGLLAGPGEGFLVDVKSILGMN